MCVVILPFAAFTEADRHPGSVSPSKAGVDDESSDAELPQTDLADLYEDSDAMESEDEARALHEAQDDTFRDRADTESEDDGSESVS